MPCFDPQNMVDVTLCKFQGWALRDLWILLLLAWDTPSQNAVRKPKQPCGEAHVGENLGALASIPS